MKLWLTSCAAVGLTIGLAAGWAQVDPPSGRIIPSPAAPGTLAPPPRAASSIATRLPPLASTRKPAPAVVTVTAAIRPPARATVRPTSRPAAPKPRPASATTTAAVVTTTSPTLQPLDPPTTTTATLPPPIVNP